MIMIMIMIMTMVMNKLLWIMIMSTSKLPHARYYCDYKYEWVVINCERDYVVDLLFCEFLLWLDQVEGD